MYFKGVITELLWFLRGETNIKSLVDNDCHIWDGDAYKNFIKNPDYKSKNAADLLGSQAGQLLIAVPHTHEASRYLGLSKFSYRDCEGGGKDSAWCTTYKAPDHFNDYYFKQQITFYYIRIKDEAMIELAKAAFPARGAAMVVTAVLVDKNGKVSSCYDGTDKVMSGAEITKFRKIIGI